MKSVWIGLIIALITAAIDQVSKIGTMYFFGIDVREILSLSPQVDLYPQGMSESICSLVSLSVTWNKGISYGLFQQSTEFGRWLLAGFSVVAILILIYWLRTSKRLLVTFSLGLIIGGALGNAWDRVAYGAVFDFIHLHFHDLSWYIFNVADAAIVIGVAGMIYDALFPQKTFTTRL